MKKFYFGLLLCFWFFLASLFAQETKMTVAVMELDAKEGVSVGVASIISDYLRTQIVNTDKFTMVTRENMETILKEQNFQISGCTSQECIIQVGQLLGVRKMFTGSIGKVGTTYLINLKLINIETGKIEKAEPEKVKSEDELLSAVSNLANKMAGLSTTPEILLPPPQIKASQPKPIVSLEKKVSPAGDMDWWDYYGEGKIFAQLGKLEEAKNAFLGAISLESRDRCKARTYGMHFIEYFPHRELGIIYYRFGEIEKAKEELKKSISMEKSPKAQEYLKLME